MTEKARLSLSKQIARVLCVLYNVVILSYLLTMTADIRWFYELEVDAVFVLAILTSGCTLVALISCRSIHIKVALIANIIVWLIQGIVWTIVGIVYLSKAEDGDMVAGLPFVLGLLLILHGLMSVVPLFALYKRKPAS